MSVTLSTAPFQGDDARDRRSEPLHSGFRLEDDQDIDFDEDDFDDDFDDDFEEEDDFEDDLPEDLSEDDLKRV